jgi:hypothetical protein
MATDKKAFVLYSDLIGNIDHLTNEEKGILFTHLLEYVNDLNPVLEDRLILTAWKPIQRQLERDLEKYKAKKLQWSEAGKRSAEVRKANKNERTLTDVEERSTDLTVKDTVSVTVKDTVKDNKETIKGIYEFFNLERKDLPQAIKLNDSRKKLIKNRLEEYDEDTIKKVIIKARNNNFLNGNETKFRANFDWIFNKANFLKILEGNYENEKTNFGKDKPAFKLNTNRPN